MQHRVLQEYIFSLNTKIKFQADTYFFLYMLALYSNQTTCSVICDDFEDHIPNLN